MSFKTIDGFYTNDIEHEVPSSGKVLYLCNRQACARPGCLNNECFHTSIAFYAKYKTHPNRKTFFKKDINGTWWEVET